MKNTIFTNESTTSVVSKRILYTPSNFAKSSLLFLQEIGELTAKKVHTSAREDLKSYLFFYVVSGEGKLSYKGKNHELGEGDCVFIDCNNPYSHITDENNLWTLRWCHFYGLNLPQIYHKYCERGGQPVFKPRDVKEFDDVWEFLIDTAEGNDYIRDMRLNEGFNRLLTLIMSESWNPSERNNRNSKQSEIIHVKEYLDEHFVEKISLDQLSEMFFINKFYLTRKYKEQYGMTISAYLMNLRITKAKQMLRFTEKSVEDIGHECGLGELNYFSRVFKEIEGVSPSLYRKQW